MATLSLVLPLPFLVGDVFVWRSSQWGGFFDQSCFGFIAFLFSSSDFSFSQKLNRQTPEFFGTVDLHCTGRVTQPDDH